MNDIEEKIEEPLETFHVYITKEVPEPPVIDSVPPVKKTPLYPLIPLILCSLAIIGTLISNPLTPVAPTQETLFHTYTIPGDIESRTLPPVTMRQTVSIATTGKGHTAATHSHGYLVFFNGSFSQQTIPQNMIFDANGVEIVTDSPVSVPAGNPPTYGVATVSAHALISGSRGNIAAYAIDTPCCFSALKVVNLAAFTGGKNARDYHMVRHQDIDSSIPNVILLLYKQEQTALQTGLTPDAAFIALPCSTKGISNRRVGQESKTVKVTVAETCSAIVYSRSVLASEAMKLVHVPVGYVLVKLSVHTISTSVVGNKSIEVVIIISMRYNAIVKKGIPK